MDPVGITMLAREIFHLQRSNEIITDCDAASCYDCIIPSVTPIAETNIGAPEEVLITFAKTLKEMEYFMSTQRGVSEKSNTHMEESPLFGTCQGATDSLTTWNLIGNIIVKAYNKNVKGCTLRKKKKISLIC
eukprot:12640949-Ditylum_brightwellii.AAC.1